MNATARKAEPFDWVLLCRSLATLSAYHVGDDCGRDSQILHPYKSYLYILLDSESGFSKKKESHIQGMSVLPMVMGYPGETPPLSFVLLSAHPPLLQRQTADPLDVPWLARFRLALHKHVSWRSKHYDMPPAKKRWKWNHVSNVKQKRESASKVVHRG